MLHLSSEAKAARNVGLLALANEGEGVSKIRIYAASGGQLLAERKLAKPCGEITSNGRIRLILDGQSHDIILVTGEAKYAEWISADDVVLASGAVTDADGAGPWKIVGASGTRIYAGGVITISSAVVG